MNKKINSQMSFGDLMKARKQEQYDAMRRVAETKESDSDDEEPCWEGYEQVGMKEKDGKEVPNCVPKDKKE